MTVARRKKLPELEARTPVESLLFALKRALLERTDTTWRPFEAYYDDPCGFAREVLGATLWDKQIELFEAVRDNPRVSVSAGQKVSKTFSAAALAIWFYCTRNDARVLLTASVARVVERGVWRELVKQLRAAKWPIPGRVYEQASSGVRSEDLREIVGFTARTKEDAAGISGENILYIIDEASGMSDDILEAIEGNRAGSFGGSIKTVMFSQPTKTEGGFFDSHHSKKEFYKCLVISSADTPNVREGRNVIPGLAGRDWLEEKKREWGEESALYKIRVLGQFALNEDGKILSVHAIAAAERRWYEAGDEGELSIGVDPAGPGGQGDESVFAVTRGLRCGELVAKRGLTPDGHVAMVVGLVRERRKSTGERARVIVDRDGPVGAAVYGAMITYLRGRGTDPDFIDFWLVGVRGGERATRQPTVYQLIRDEVWASLAEWVKAGGAIPENAKLSRELHAPEWIGQVSGRLKATAKDELRKMLGRSPDHADALALSVWQADHTAERVAEQQAAIANANAAPPARVPRIDPYAGGGAGRSGGMDPYRSG